MTHNSMVFDPRDTALPLLAPGILLLMGYALLSGIGSLPWSWRAGLALAPYAVLAGGLVVSCVFHCGRAVYSLLLVAIGHWLLVEYFAGGWRGGVAADMAAIIQGEAFDHLDAPVEIVAGRNLAIPYNHTLEQACHPQLADIVAAGRRAGSG